MITHYKDTKGSAKRTNCGGLAWLGVTQCHWQCCHSTACIKTSYLTSI